MLVTCAALLSVKPEYGQPATVQAPPTAQAALYDTLLSVWR